MLSNRDRHVPWAQVRVLLCSTKAGGVGLNLTCASRVILIDVWWNSAPEDQVGSPAGPAKHGSFAMHAVSQHLPPSNPHTGAQKFLFTLVVTWPGTSVMS